MEVAFKQIAHRVQIMQLLRDRKDIVIGTHQGGQQAVVVQPRPQDTFGFHDRPFACSTFSGLADFRPTMLPLTYGNATITP